MTSQPRQALPDIDRISVLAATILLAYALTRFVDIPARGLSFRLLGIALSFEVNFRTIVSLLVAALAATGADWLLRAHPAVLRQQNGGLIFQHWILPALTAWVIGVPLNNLAGGPQWWIVFALGGALLVMVFVAEYTVADVTDLRHPVATVGLTALSFALLLMLAIALRSAGLRLYQVIPPLAVAIFVVALRTLYLRLGGRWLYLWAALIALVVSQVAVGLHYLPLKPVQAGLALIAPAYALTGMAIALEEGRGDLRGLIEPAVMLVVLLALALVVG
jgi:hypothetical protein